ncbi:transposase domain-containing protein [Cerasicoccus frondis]|uniref:transposase domain-containing protein n=1 Tax=Cerasicoccus frondis TaxID=490090 RepID=UPI002852C7BB|nr:transposase domain-containing protein [Cerasicoccus frondis]
MAPVIQHGAYDHNASRSACGSSSPHDGRTPPNSGSFQNSHYQVAHAPISDDDDDHGCRAPLRLRLLLLRVFPSTTNIAPSADLRKEDARQTLTEQRSALIYSIVVSCQRHGVNPFDYLRDVLTRLPKMTNQDDIGALTPSKWSLPTT